MPDDGNKQSKMSKASEPTDKGYALDILSSADIVAGPEARGLHPVWKKQRKSPLLRRHRDRERDQDRGQTTNKLAALPALPVELQLMVMAFLDLPGLLSLRRTSRFYQGLITRDVVASLLLPPGTTGAYPTAGPGTTLTAPPEALLGCCVECLSTPGRGALVLDREVCREGEGGVPHRPIPGYLIGAGVYAHLPGDEVRTRSGVGGWCSVCLQCWRPRQTPAWERLHGVGVELASGYGARPCGICGWIVGHGRDSRPPLAWHKLYHHRGWCIRMRWTILVVVSGSPFIYCSD